MAFFADTILDAGLQYLRDKVNEMHITSAEATTYTEATSTLTLANKAAPALSAQADYGGAGAGRKVEVATFTDGTVTATGTGSHYALVDTVGLELVATGALSATQALTNGNPLSLTQALPLVLNDAVAI
ncbi:hypothetical protein DDZ14_16055 [Maritimibacter sp. 55A14]|uniref:hypothetical protein n=1 Tax=Maritimibacter sp. 55A14 TaxID=2174844 RepID=UPI000D619796|nr:hypothetical protein [Maritimibacter sp. 55A14]PWE29954.1 hypothetical protein DDZ14_16055 [Maritimibacter sp. 55A14]